MNKTEFRIFAKNLRGSLPIREYSEIICDKLKNLDVYRKAKNILLYSSFSSEIITESLLEDETKNIYLPRIVGNELDICIYSAKNDCSVNKYGILEPSTEKIKNVKDIDIAVIPALCANKQGYRLGYGKGYYDRFIPNLNKTCVKILLLPQELVFDDIPTEAHDTKADIIITQNCLMFI